MICSTLCRSLNSRLPSTVIANCAARVDDSFDARRHAVGRSYRYTICDKPVSVFSMRFAWHVPISSASLSLLDVDKMNDAASTLLVTDSGAKENYRRDLRAFRRANAQASHTLIRVSHASVRRCSAGHFVHVDITADWFIYGMMRLLTATLVQVGLHRISVNEFRRIVESGLRENVTYGAPAKGLCLIEVHYDEKDNPFKQQYTDKLLQQELGSWPNVVHPWYLGLEA